MAKTATLAVRIIGDSTGATKAIAEVEGSVAGLEASTASSGRKMAGVWGAVTAAIVGSAKAASDLEQAAGAVEQIFGEMAPQVMDWAEGMAEYGLSTAQAAQAAAVLGAQLTNLGIPLETSAQLTADLIALGADMAAVFGGTVPQAVGALGAALRGEFDTLERYGISLTAATVEAEAMRLASEGLAFASEQQAKAVATLSLIQQQSTEIVGAAAEESDTLAASMGQLRAQVTNLAAEIGGVLNVVLGPLIGLLGDVIGRVSNLIAESELLTGVTNVLSSAMDRLANLLNATLVPILERARQTMDSLARLIDTYVMPIVDALSNAFDALADAIGTVVGWVQEAIDWFNSLIGTIHEAIDALTFWNDTYQASTSLSAPMPTAAPAALGAAPAALAAAPVTINVQAGIGDPHSIAREIRRVLRQDDARMGRVRAVEPKGSTGGGLPGPPGRPAGPAGATGPAGPQGQTGPAGADSIPRRRDMGGHL
jgi:phage-related protein